MDRIKKRILMVRLSGNHGNPGIQRILVQTIMDLRRRSWTSSSTMILSTGWGRKEKNDDAG